MKTLFNPTGNDLNITYKGSIYSLESNSESKPLSDEVVSFWKRMHEFLIEKEVTSVPTAQVEIVETKEETSETAEANELKEETQEKEIIKPKVVKAKKVK